MEPFQSTPSSSQNCSVEAGPAARSGNRNVRIPRIGGHLDGYDFVQEPASFAVCPFWVSVPPPEFERSELEERAILSVIERASNSS